MRTRLVLGRSRLRQARQMASRSLRPALYGLLIAASATQPNGIRQNGSRLAWRRMSALDRARQARKSCRISRRGHEGKALPSGGGKSSAIAEYDARLTYKNLHRFTWLNLL